MRGSFVDRRSGAAVVALIVAVVVLGVAVGALVAADGDDTRLASGTATAQLAAVQQACDQFASTGPMMSEPVSCAAMGAWMHDHMGASGAGASLMWGGPTRMRATCQQWMADQPPPGVRDPQAWCTGMVSWMSDHVDDWADEDLWDDWMGGPMQGGRGP